MHKSTCTSMHSKHCYPPQAKLVKILGAGGGKNFQRLQFGEKISNCIMTNSFFQRGWINTMYLLTELVWAIFALKS